VEKKLMFAGTEYGLYVSFDAGQNWNRWTNGYPTVSTYDLVIHPREHDLVIGTFGRSIWVLDDIRPLRKLASNGNAMLNSELIVIDAPDAVMAQTRNLPGYYYRGDAMFEGDNRPNSASITIYSKSDRQDKTEVEIKDDSGITIRKLEVELKKGFNRVQWNTDMEPPEIPGMIRSQQGQQRGRFGFRRGASVLPGNYVVSVSQEGVSSEANLAVLNDPRMEMPNIEAIRKNLERGRELQSKVIDYNTKYEQFMNIRTKLAKMNELITDDMPFADDYKKVYSTVNGEFNRINRLLTDRTEGLGMKMYGMNVLYTARDILTDSEEKSVEDSIGAMEEAGTLIDDFINTQWKSYLDFFRENEITLDKLVE
jgi:hypothetical protein